jgi:hypothetical protein
VRWRGSRRVVFPIAWFFLGSGIAWGVEKQRVAMGELVGGAAVGYCRDWGYWRLIFIFPICIDSRSQPLNRRAVSRGPQFRCGSNYGLLPEMTVRSAVVSNQFSEGFSARSITKTSTGPLCDSSLRPSCSCTAEKIDGCESSGGRGPVGSHA